MLIKKNLTWTRIQTRISNSTRWRSTNWATWQTTGSPYSPFCYSIPLVLPQTGLQVPSIFQSEHFLGIILLFLGFLMLEHIEAQLVARQCIEPETRVRILVPSRILVFKLVSMTYRNQSENEIFVINLPLCVANIKKTPTLKSHTRKMFASTDRWHKYWSRGRRGVK